MKLNESGDLVVTTVVHLDYGPLALPLHITAAELKAGYLECLFWAEGADDEDSELFDKVADDISVETMAAIDSDIATFLDNSGGILAYLIEGFRYTWERAGHDLYLTRNHHGAGFWDRSELPENQTAILTEMAQGLGESNHYVGDDGRVY